VWDRYGFDKKHLGTRYAELLCLRLVGYAGHSAFRCIGGAKCQRIFMLGWAQCGFHNKRVVTRDTELVFLHPV
jgi:hypothetical protein